MYNFQISDIFPPAECRDEEVFHTLEDEDDDEGVFILCSSSHKVGTRALTPASRSDCLKTARGTKMKDECQTKLVKSHRKPPL